MQLVTCLRRFFKFQIFGVILHLFFQFLDFFTKLLFAHHVILSLIIRHLQFLQTVLWMENTIDQIPDLLDDAFRSDIVFLVIGQLFRATPFRFVNCLFHRIRHFIRIQNGRPVQIPGRPTNSLDQAAF